MLIFLFSTVEMEIETQIVKDPLYTGLDRLAPYYYKIQLIWEFPY